MKKTFLFIFSLLILISCSNSENQQKQNKQVTEVVFKKDSISILNACPKLLFNTEQFNSDSTKVLVDSFQLESIDIFTFQVLPITQNPSFSCHSYLYTMNDHEIIDSIKYNSIEAVGGDWGLKYYGLIKNVLIFSKHGDYSGETILIKPNGHISTFPGGTNALSSDSNLIFSFHDSDISGLTIYNLETDSLIMIINEMEVYPHYVFESKPNFFQLLCEEHEKEVKSVWDVEIDLSRIMQLDLNEEDLDMSKRLPFMVSESLIE